MIDMLLTMVKYQQKRSHPLYFGKKISQIDLNKLVFKRQDNSYCKKLPVPGFIN